eukprot:7670781-Karenia_brevis.AAC.1
MPLPRPVARGGGSKGMGSPRVIHIRYPAGIHHICYENAICIPSNFNQIFIRYASDVNQTS